MRSRVQLAVSKNIPFNQPSVDSALKLIGGLFPARVRWQTGMLLFSNLTTQRQVEVFPQRPAALLPPQKDSFTPPLHFSPELMEKF